MSRQNTQNPDAAGADAPRQSRRLRRRSDVIWWRDGARRCSGCQDYLAPISFGPRAQGGPVGDGLDRYCLDCRAAAGKRYYDRHREAEIADTLAWRAQHREHYLTYMRGYSRERKAAARLARERSQEQAQEKAQERADGRQVEDAL